MSVYCGNNASAPELLNGSAVIGTRSRCLRKGFGAGYYSPVSDEYLGAYVPIDDRRFYCGDSEQLPAGYDDFATLSQCLQKGFGVGKMTRAGEEVADGKGEDFPTFISGVENYVSWYLVLKLVLSTVLLLPLLAALRPKWVVKSNGNLYWWRLLLLAFILSMIVLLLEYVFFKLFLRS